MPLSGQEIAIVLLGGLALGLLPSALTERRGLQPATDAAIAIAVVFAGYWLTLHWRDLVPGFLEQQTAVVKIPNYEPVIFPLPPLKTLLKPVVPRSREEVCGAVVAETRKHDIPAAFFIRLLYLESGFRPGAISSSGALGIAQFTPETAADRRLDNPFDPLQAIPASARMLRDLHRKFGNLGLAAAAYNAGPRRVSDWLAGSGGMPAETRNYVQVITGSPIDVWAKAGSGGKMPESAPPTTCHDLMALLHRAPNPFITELEQHVKLAAAKTWGVQLAAGFDRNKALAMYARAIRNLSAVIGDRDPSILSSVQRSRGAHAFYQVRIGADTRPEADGLCNRIRRAGGACFVLRNMYVRG